MKSQLPAARLPTVYEDAIVACDLLNSDFAISEILSSFAIVMNERGFPCEVFHRYYRETTQFLALGEESASSFSISKYLVALGIEGQAYGLSGVLGWDDILMDLYEDENTAKKKTGVTWVSDAHSFNLQDEANSELIKKFTGDISLMLAAKSKSGILCEIVENEKQPRAVSCRKKI